MSGLYNVVLGDGGEMARGDLLSRHLLDIPVEDYQRFRDCWIEKHGDAMRVAVYTRLGGGNRPDYAETITRLQSHHLYVADADDSYDSTYATFWFEVPEELPEHLVGVPDWDTETYHSRVLPLLGTLAVEPVDMQARWEAAFERLRTEGPTQAEMDAVQPLLDALRDVKEE